MALCSLVGRLSYRHLCSSDLATWMTNSWRPVVRYVPTLTPLGRGWLHFHFKSPEDTTNILERLWTIDDNNLMLKRWRVSFDPAQDYFRLRHLWVLLPGLPLHIWNEKALMAIGNSLGRFISIDSKTNTGRDKRLARILVEIDIHEGLSETLDIDWRGHITRQKLDYLGIPFRCTLCRQTGHLRKTCTGIAEEDTSEETMLELSTNLGSPPTISHLHYPDLSDDSSVPDLDSISGKLKNICPTLFSSLTTLELDFINNIPLNNLGQVSSPPETRSPPLTTSSQHNLPRTLSTPTETTPSPIHPSTIPAGENLTSVQLTLSPPHTQFPPSLTTA
jgi:hypothetical protein